MIEKGDENSENSTMVYSGSNHRIPRDPANLTLKWSIHLGAPHPKWFADGFQAAA